MHKRLTRRIAVIAVAALGVVALGGTALAGHLGAVKSYTGCLVPRDGVIIKVKEGNAPASPCTGGMQQVHLSGGDITKISVTGALTGGGDNGEVTIALKPEFTLPTGCAAGDGVEWSGSAWVCGASTPTAPSVWVTRVAHADVPQSRLAPLGRSPRRSAWEPEATSSRPPSKRTTTTGRTTSTCLASSSRTRVPGFPSHLEAP